MATANCEVDNDLVELERAFNIDAEQSEASNIKEQKRSRRSAQLQTNTFS